MKTVVLYGLPEREQRQISQGIEDKAQVRHECLPLHLAPTHQDANIICVMPNSEVSAGILMQIPDLEAVVTLSAGTDHIDRPHEFHRRGVNIIRDANYATDPVSEYTVACIVHAYKERYFTDVPREIPQGLYKKRVLIVGFGNIGKALAQKLHALGMEISVFSSVVIDSELFPYVRKCEDLKTGASEVDVIALHTSLRDNTQGMINRNVLNSVKPGAILINAARGELIDDGALLHALDEGIFHHIFLDVISDSQKSGCQRILAHDKVTFTQHTAWITPSAIEHRIQNAIKHICALL